ncbi:hypothetical protein Glove_609g12 [Diversispora epigaea]|uniref:Uncharacterized protein n=1 Tax=Diversispora epigaea TaxID=1348612 RepID=A0A397GEY3_9GLOM|nr:hypothetical protein Glove_609g12 [Diversispora epigaea]
MELAPRKTQKTSQNLRQKSTRGRKAFVTGIMIKLKEFFINNLVSIKSSKMDIIKCSTLFNIFYIWYNRAIFQFEELGGLGGQKSRTNITSQIKKNFEK